MLLYIDEDVGEPAGVVIALANRNRGNVFTLERARIAQDLSILHFHSS